MQQLPGLTSSILLACLLDYLLQFKGGDAEFVPTRLMTRLTYTLDEVWRAAGLVPQFLGGAPAICRCLPAHACCWCLPPGFLLSPADVAAGVCDQRCCVCHAACASRSICVAASLWCCR